MKAATSNRGHRWLPEGRGRSRCARCDALRVILDDGELQFFTASGRKSADPPLCAPKSGARRFAHAEAAA